jgi:Flp pilus assembly protein TadG
MGMPKRRAGERGTAALEFALVSTVLFAVLLGTIQYGMYFFAVQNGTSVAREAVRRAAVGACTDTQLTSYVNAKISGGGATATRTFKDTTGATAAAPGVVGGVVQVTVTFPTLDLHLPFVPTPHSPARKVVQARLENNPTIPGPCV